MNILQNLDKSADWLFLTCHFKNIILLIKPDISFNSFLMHTMCVHFSNPPPLSRQMVKFVANLGATLQKS